MRILWVAEICLLYTQPSESCSQEGEWTQKWSVSFVTPGANTELKQISHDSDVKCFKINEAFSPSFEEFAKGLAIHDPSDEDQCRNVREVSLGFYTLHHMIGFCHWLIIIVIVVVIRV